MSGISSGILQRACVLSISFQYGGRRRADFHLTCNSDILNCLKWSLACEERAILSTKCTKWLPILCIIKFLGIIKVLKTKQRLLDLCHFPHYETMGRVYWRTWNWASWPLELCFPNFILFFPWNKQFSAEFLKERAYGVQLLKLANKGNFILFSEFPTWLFV